MSLEKHFIMYEQNRVSTAMDAPHFMGQLWQLSSRVRMVSMVFVHCSWISSVQKPFLRWRAFPHMKFSVCHFSSWIAISWGDPSPARMGMTPGMGFLSRFLMYFRASLQCWMNSTGWAMLMSFVPGRRSPSGSCPP